MNPDLYTARRVAADETRIRFPQPGVLLNLNHRVHWRRRAAVTKQWRTAAYWAAMTLAPDPVDRAHDHRYVWALRLTHGINIGIITTTETRDAWENAREFAA